MRFRHLDYRADTPVEELGAAGLDDLLDRGDLAAWTPLARAIRRDPFGEPSETVLDLCEAHPMYGTSSLWRTWIERLRAGAPAGSVTLSELRERAGLTQERVAEQLGTSQSDVSKLERRADLKLSTLRSYVAGLGGRLDVMVKLRGATPLRLRLPASTRADIKTPGTTGFIHLSKRGRK